MPAADPATAQASQPSADGAAVASTSTPPSTPTNASTSVASSATATDAGAQSADSTSTTSSTSGESQAGAPDLWSQVTELDADELLQKHPRLAKRLGALADKQVTKRLAVEREQAAAAAEQAAERRKADLLLRAEQGDPDADTELLELTKRELSSKYGQKAVAEQLSKAEQTARARIWEQHAQSFGLDPDDEDVAEVIKEAGSFKALNVALLGLAKDVDAVEQMWKHPEIQKRHKAALSEARAAATINGQASVIGDKRLDLTASGGGRPQTADEVIAEYAAIWQRGQKPSAELTDAYRRVTGRVRAA